MRASFVGNTLAMVCCTTRVDSRIPQQSSGSPRISHDSLVWDATKGWWGATHDACSVGGVRVGYPIEKFQRKFRRGTPPYAALERFGVAQTDAPPVWGGVPPYAGSEGVLLNSVVGAVLGGRGRSWAAGPLRPALP